ncbi:MAG: chaperone modulator CbpM [Spongiibacteraceae bacterium]|jgi:chaperone modulatory protein CbpM|nr:chaperone modulator CbpM [Spongiibacteraceae bacterium]
MADEEIITGVLVEESWTTLEQAAAVCCVEVEWLVQHVESGLLPGADQTGGTWRLSTTAVRHAQRMRRIERDFDAVPELAALVADLQEELDRLRTRLAIVEQRTV